MGCVFFAVIIVVCRGLQRRWWTKLFAFGGGGFRPRALAAIY
jgi:hypothetical protein